MKKVKKGSSLICVVIMFALLVIAGTTLMMAIFNGYKLRIRNNARVRNLYGAESGLEKAYANVSNLIDESIVKGNEAVTEYNKDLVKILEEERERLDKFIKAKKAAKDNNEKFDQVWSSKYIYENGSLNETYIYEERNKAFKQGYHEKKGYKEWVKINIKDRIESKEDTDKYVVNIVSEKNKNYELLFNDKEEAELDIESRFEDKSINRVLKTTFNIKTPEYNKPQNYKTVSIPVKTVWTKAFVAGGDLINKSNVEIDGDIYVYGKKEEKTSEGIVLEKDSSFALNNGELVSLEDIWLKESGAKFKVKSSDDTEVGISKVFTGSLVIGDKFSTNKNKKDMKVSGAEINVNGKVYANNDLVLNGEKSTINISKGFYGINDVGVEGEDISKQVKNSSCLIVNSNDIGEKNGSSITIENEAIFMGTAYIYVNPVYQTGESIAIKGNYRAYGAPLKDETYKEDKMIFEYRDPLQLVTGFKGGNQLLYNQKEEYLSKYIDEYKGLNINKGKGIKMPEGNKSISIGAAFYNDSFLKGNYIIDYKPDIDRYKNKYEMTTKQLLPVKEEIKFENFKNKANKVDNTLKTNSKEVGKDIIYLNSTGDPCTLLGENASEVDGTGNVIKLGKESKGIIISNGDIYIKGRIDEFKGTIITAGSIILEGSESKKFIYDSNYLKNLVAANYEIFNGIFIGKDLSNQVIRLDKDESGADKPVSSYVRQNLLKSKNWNIKK